MLRMQRKYLVVFGVIVILVVGLVVLTTRNNDDKNTTGTNNSKISTVTSDSDGPRKNDAESLLQAAEKFAASNNGKQANGWSDNQLTGGNNVEFELEYYESVSVKSGPQPAMAKDALMLVTNASCGDNGQTVSGSSRSDAVLYLLSSGPTCRNM